MKVDSQKSKVQGKLRKGVFFPAAGALVIFIGLVAAFPDKAYEVLTGLLYKMGGSCGWAIELLIFFVFVGGLILACTKYGNIRISGENAKPLNSCGAGSPCPSAVLSVQASSSGHWENRSISIWDLQARPA